MAFWNRRKVIYNWDHNYVPTTDAGLNSEHVREWIWQCPEDRYIELTAVKMSLVVGAGIRSSTVEYALYSSQEHYFKYQIHNNLASLRNHVFYLSTSGAQRQQTPPFGILVDWLPFNVRMIPGDSIRFRIGGSFFAGDNWTYWALRYNRYDLT